jgi:hypothetical protein
MDHTESLPSIIACSLFSVETCPQRCSLVMTVVLLLGNGSTCHNIYLESLWNNTVLFHFDASSFDRNQSLIIEILCLMIQFDVVFWNVRALFCTVLLEKTVFHLVSMRTCNFIFPVFIWFTSMITDGTNYSEILVYILNCKKLAYFVESVFILMI